MNEYIMEYVSLCRQLNNYSPEGVVKHNRSMKKLSKLYLGLKKNRSFAEEIMQQLLRMNDDNVLIMAAAQCLGLNIFTDTASEALKYIAKCSNNAFIRISAEVTLETWKRGDELKF